MTERDAPDLPLPAREPAAAGGAGPGDPERRLAEAAARSPELAAMLAAGRVGRRPRRPSRAALALAGVAAGAIVAALTAGLTGKRGPEPVTPPPAVAPAPEAPSPPGTLIPPLETARDAATGEEVAPFSGFALSVDTEPPGAVVAVDGAVRGESPVFVGLACTPGAPISVRAEKPGLPPREARTACRADTLVKLRIRLGR